LLALSLCEKSCDFSKSGELIRYSIYVSLLIGRLTSVLILYLGSLVVTFYEIARCVTSSFLLWRSNHHLYPSFSMPTRSSRQHNISQQKYIHFSCLYYICRSPSRRKNHFSQQHTRIAASQDLVKAPFPSIDATLNITNQAQQRLILDQQREHAVI